MLSLFKSCTTCYSQFKCPKHVKTSLEPILSILVLTYEGVDPAEASHQPGDDDDDEYSTDSDPMAGVRWMEEKTIWMRWRHPLMTLEEIEYLLLSMRNRISLW